MLFTQARQPLSLPGKVSLNGTVTTGSPLLPRMMKEGPTHPRPRCSYSVAKLSEPLPHGVRLQLMVRFRTIGCRPDQASLNESFGAHPVTSATASAQPQVDVRRTHPCASTS
jgi:hypothetical protein